MANCKICGKPVQVASVHHAACWEREAEKFAEKFCDEYCRYPLECKGEEDLHENHCDGCDLIRLLNLGL